MTRHPRLILLRRSPQILASADSTLLKRVAVLRNGGLSQDEVIKVLTVHPQVRIATVVCTPIRHPVSAVAVVHVGRQITVDISRPTSVL